MTITIGKAVGASPHGWHRLASFLRCPHEYLQSEVRGIKVPMEYTPDPLAQGLLFHAMRAKWFASEFKTDAETWAAVKQAAVEATYEMPAPMMPESEEKAMYLFQEYIQYWKNQPLPKPVACEYLLESKLDPNDPDEVKFTARIDDCSVYPEAGGLAIGEAKTSSDFNNTQREFYLHGQPYLQAALWKVAPQGEAMHGPIKGYVIDIARKPQGTPGKKGYWKPAFMRVFQPIKPEALAWYVNGIRLAKMKALTFDWNGNSSGMLPDRNISACTRMIGRARVECPYLQLCAHGQSAAGNYLTKDGRSLAEWTPTERESVAPWL